jgi:hypothetical protein
VAGTKADKAESFQFQVKIKDEKGNYLTFSDGGTTANVTLKNGQSVTWSGLPRGYSYEIQEVLTDSQSNYQTTYTATDGASGTGTAVTGSNITVADGTNTVAFTNTDTRTYSLTLSKAVTGTDKTDSFTFDVYLTNGDGTAPTGTYTASVTGLEIPSSVTFTAMGDQLPPNLSSSTYKWSKAQVTVQAGRSVTIQGLPVGSLYTVLEEAADNYSVAEVKVNGTAASGTNSGVLEDVSTNQTVAFTNAYTGKSLTITKTVTGAFGDRSEAFPFTVTLTDKNGSPLTGSVTIDGETDPKDLDATGAFTVDLKHGEQVTIKDLPAGTQYSITEGNAEAYTTSIRVTGGNIYGQTQEKTKSGAVTEDVTVDYTNDRSVAVTGVTQTVLPFMLLFTFALGTALVLMIRKRKARKEM